MRNALSQNVAEACNLDDVIHETCCGDGQSAATATSLLLLTIQTYF